MLISDLSNIFLHVIPGLLIAVVVIQGLRMNFMGAMASKIGSDMHLGTFRWSFAPGETLFDESVLSFVSLLFSVPLVLVGVYAVQLLTHTFEISPAVLFFVVLCAMIPSTVIQIVVCVVMSFLALRYDWDLDNFLIPLVTSLGDISSCVMFVLTVLMVQRLQIGTVFEASFDLFSCALVFVILVAVLRSYLRGSHKDTIYENLVRTMVQSWIILIPCLVLELVAALCLVQLQDMYFVVFPILYVYFNSYLEGTNAIAGVMSSRYVSKLHQGEVLAESLNDRSWMEFLMGLILMLEIQLTVMIFAWVTKVPIPSLTGATTFWGSYLWLLMVMGIIYLLSTLVLTIQVMGGIIILAWLVSQYEFSLDACVYPILSSCIDCFGALTLTLIAAGVLRILC